jgi:hypothetical protein
MFFLYSRKPQFVLLLCWCAALAFMFTDITGGESQIFTLDGGVKPAQDSEPRLGDEHVPPLEVAPEQPQSAVTPDPVLNQGTALRVIARPDGDENGLVLEFDYVPAQTKGFTPDRARNYYIEEPPAFVVSLGEPWVADIEPKFFPVDMRQASGVSLIVSQSRHLRLLTHVHTRDQAAEAKARISRTKTGLKAEIHFGR